MPNPPTDRSVLSMDSVLPKSESSPLPDPLGETQNFDKSGTSSNSFYEIFGPSEMIDRYKIDSLLGEGGYGQVFKAFDERLERYVAIKIPHQNRLPSKIAIDRYREEARTLAKLDHASVVAIHDVGDLQNGLPYIVSSFVDGSNLAQRMREDPLSLADGISILVTIGQALAYVHSRDVVHRDIKPANILLSKDGQAFLADFGLALNDEVDIDDRRRRVGTPSYMSPEQARCENHLVDGRSDIFSLGIVMYQMLTGNLPFRGESRRAVFDKLLNSEARPLRQVNISVPRELERICLKALAKRSADRYPSAVDFVEDIKCFLNTFNQTGSEENSLVASGIPEVTERATVVPRGLRSFDRHDAEFFNRLLPGPYDRDWTPESVLFWKRAIESVDQDTPLRIGVIYGPSGCGKSSFIRAGLVPMLDESIKTVFVEATRDDTEARILRGVRKRCVGLSANDLPGTFAEVRRRGEDAGGDRYLIVIDQFEQWLHGRSDLDNSALALALRQCDGHTLQCIVLLRDEFWLAMSRLASVLEVPLKQNQNITLVDLFSQHHARRVLADFGVAYDRLPESSHDRTNEQIQFLDHAIEELSEDGKITPVRLSVFVEMVKSQPWEMSTLERMGGVEGIGTQFLEESFSSSHAPASRRVHEEAVRNILRQLLPDQGGNLKGNMKTEDELLSVSGYSDDPGKFDTVMQILDDELRLITPTDPTGRGVNDEHSVTESDAGIRYYQLTHDFLVPALYEWLNKKQRETKRGRAELRLTEYANLWASKPIPQFAPSFLDWLNIRRLVSPNSWNTTERRMMKMAGKRHISAVAIAIGLLVTLGVATLVVQHRNQVHSLVRQLKTAQTTQLQSLLEQLKTKHLFAPAALTQQIDSVASDSRECLVSRLALHAIQPSDSAVDAQWLTDKALTEPLPMVALIRDQLGALSKQVTTNCIDCLTNESEETGRRLRAAIVLAKHHSSGMGDKKADQLWAEQSELIIQTMLSHLTTTPSEYNALVDALQSQREALLPPLRATALQPDSSQDRANATGILINYFRDQPKRLLNIALEASDEQHPAFMEVLGENLDDFKPVLTREASAEIDTNLPAIEFDRLANRKGTAAALLHKVGLGDSTWPLLEHSAYPNTKTYLLHRIPTLGGDFDSVLLRLQREPNESVRQSLIVCLGLFEWKKISSSTQNQALVALKDSFQNDPDVGVHSAAQWTLRRFGQDEWIDATLAKLGGKERSSRANWYVNKHGQTMAVFDARDVPGIERIFEISTMEVSVEQFQRLFPGQPYYEYRSPTTDCPMGLLDWYDAIEYCRMLSDEHGMSPEQSYPKNLSVKSESQDVDYVLNGDNYRLPTSAEWAFVVKAQTKTMFYYGLNWQMLDHYQYYWDAAIDSSTGKVRYFPSDTKIPSASGIFAMYDGTREWGHEVGLNGDTRRAVLGDHNSVDREHLNQRKLLGRDLPNARNGYYGLRVARTIVE